MAAGQTAAGDVEDFSVGSTSNEATSAAISLRQLGVRQRLRQGCHVGFISHKALRGSEAAFTSELAF